MRHVHLDGQIVREDEARVSPFDRGLLLGDGVFETLRAYDGRPHALGAHLDRLRRSCALTRLPMPEDLPRRVQETLAANGLADASVRITITRGPGGRGASPRGAGPATVLVTASPIAPQPETYERGLRLVTATRRRVGRDALDPSIKSIGYLVHVLARAEAEEAGADDALFVDDQDRVVEATQANVFAVRGDDLLTPPLASGCLPGVTRAEVLALAPGVGLRPQEQALTLRDLADADEVLLTASLLEVAPVVSLDGARIGDGRPGPRARELHASYRKHASSG